MGGAGIIAPIHKGGNIDDPKNYRGITLINVIAKIYSQILLNRLTHWSIKHDKLIQNQFGFQKGKSTIDCVFMLYSIILKSFSLNKKLYCAFIDFEKCFDKLSRIFIFQKLLKENVSTKFVSAIQNMYSVVKAAVRFNSELSNYFISNIGAKQGDPSSSLLFLYFVNDIVSSFNENIEGLFELNDMKLFILLFADDAVLFAHTPEALQSLLNDLSTYCNTWGLKINTNKTKIMIFERGRHTKFDFSLNNSILKIVTSFKYLGVHFFKNANLNRTQKALSQHASSSLHNLFIVFNQLDLDIRAQCKLFDSLVGSILHYGSEILCIHEGKDLELIHCKFLRRILCVKKSTNLDGLYGETGRYPLSVHCKIMIFKYWIKILKQQEHSFIKLLYKPMKNDCDLNITYSGKNWAYQIKTLLNELGLTCIWNHQDDWNVNINTIKQETYRCI